MISRFHMVRDVDHTGISGTGVVAEGVLFSDGTVALRWLGKNSSTGIWQSMDKVLSVHGHGGATRIEFLDSMSAGAPIQDLEVWPEVPEKVDDGTLLTWMGTDPQRWARAFALHATRVEETISPEFFGGWLMIWFSGALEAGARRGL